MKKLKTHHYILIFLSLIALVIAVVYLVNKKDTEEKAKKEEIKNVEAEMRALPYDYDNFDNENENEYESEIEETAENLAIENPELLEEEEIVFVQRVITGGLSSNLLALQEQWKNQNQA